MPIDPLLPYACSVRWGAGFHYFLGYYESKDLARTAAKAWLAHRRPKKGAKPAVHVWYLIDTFRKD